MKIKHAKNNINYHDTSIVLGKAEGLFYADPNIFIIYQIHNHSTIIYSYIECYIPILNLLFNFIQIYIYMSKITFIIFIYFCLIRMI